MRNPSRSLEEKYHLIMECRSSGLTDKEWCEGKGIPQSTFYAWLKQVKASDEVIPKVHKKAIASAPEIVRLDVPTTMEKIKLDAPLSIKENKISHDTAGIMIETHGIKVHVANNADPMMLAQTLKIIRATLC